MVGRRYPDGMTVDDLMNELRRFQEASCGGHVVSFYGMKINHIYEDTENGLWAELSSEDYSPFIREVRRRAIEKGIEGV